MAISIRRYVEITSGVGAGTIVRLRELIARLFSTNPLIPTKSLIEFDSADEVRQYLGVNSAEYLRALFYFGWISLLITRPNKTSVARWAEVDTARLLFGAGQQQSLSSWTNMTDGAFSIAPGSDTNEVAGLNASAATTLADVATVIQ